MSTRDAIEDTVRSYGLHIDLLEFDQLRDLLTDDARAAYGGRDWVQGADAIVAFVQGHAATRAFAQHLISVARVDMDGTSATVIANMTAVQASTVTPTRAAVHHGRYHVRLAIDGVRWRITELRLEVLYRSEISGSL